MIKCEYKEENFAVFGKSEFETFILVHVRYVVPMLIHEERLSTLQSIFILWKNTQLTTNSFTNLVKIK